MIKVIGILAVFLAIAFDLILIFWLRRWFRHIPTAKKSRLGIFFLGVYSPVLAWFRTGHIDYKRPKKETTQGWNQLQTFVTGQITQRWNRLQTLAAGQITQGWNRLQTFAARQTGKKIGIASELILIGIWAFIVSWNYMNLNPRVWPGGHEFGSAIQANNFWIQLRNCGWCAMWSGFERGGHPALADVQGSMLHPIVIVTTLIWGVVNGAKFTFVIALWCAGFAQWWMARSLKLSFVPRLWSAAIAVAGGYLTGRMELGVIGVVLSTAMSSLVLAGVVHLATNPGRRAAILLGVLFASAILSGQGYMQIGLLGISPALLFLLLAGKQRLLQIGKEFFLAGVLGLLLASPFLVPFLHFSPNFAKDTDSSFKEAQPLAYLPLNLVINDVKYYQSDSLGKYPYPYQYNLYIGWIPVGLAIFGIAKCRPQDRKLFWFMGCCCILTFLIASAVTLKWLVKIWPAVSGVRHPPQIASLAVPFILAFSAFGLEQLFASLRHWLNLSFVHSRLKAIRKLLIPLRWLLLVPLICSIVSVYSFAKIWTTTRSIGDDVYSLLSVIKTSSLEWVEPPYGEHYWIQPAIELGLKLSPGIMTWTWQGRTDPAAALYASRDDKLPSQDKKIGILNGITIYASNEEYAVVVHNQTQEPCTASGSGGQITVRCDTMEPGQLVIKENMWTGWYAWMDGQSVKFYHNRWLEVDAPAGKHAFTFRYLPWDVPVGLALFVLGACACIWLWFKLVEAKPVQMI